MLQADMPLLDRCHAMQTSGGLQLSELRGILEAGDLTDTQIAELQTIDPAHPYGRRVLFANDRVEAMLATWTRGVPCVPHDHGGSLGAVRVLRGRARHRVWRVVDGRLELQLEHTAKPGDVLCCGPDMVHSMGDDGADEPLVTLHLYSDAIDYMVVFDVDGDQTYVVDGGCGAWIPGDQPGLIRKVLPGIVAACDVAQSM